MYLAKAKCSVNLIYMKDLKLVNQLGPRGDFATDRQAERQFGYLPNAFDNEYDYFKDQLTAYKLYRISDIITDREVK